MEEQVCKSNEHVFVSVETTPITLSCTPVLPVTIERTFKLYCSRCGEVRNL